MKKSWFVLFLCLPFMVQSQEITVSEEIPISGRRNYEIIGSLKNQTLVFTKQNFDYKIKCLDASMKLSWEKELTFEKKQTNVLGVERLKDGFILIYSYEKNRQFIVNAHKYDIDANLRDSITIKNFGSVYPTPGFNVVRSEDRSKLLLYYIEQQKKLHSVSFDLTNLQTLWEKSMLLTQKDVLKDWPELQIADNGDLFLFYIKDNFRSKKKRPYYHIFHYQGAKQFLRNWKIDLDLKLSVEVAFTIDNKNGQIIATGLYGTRTRTKAVGYFYARMPFDYKGAHILKFHEFDVAFLSDLLDEKIKKNKGSDQISLQESILRQDGGILLFLEHDNRSKARKAASRAQNLPLRGEIIKGRLQVLSIHPDGKEHWSSLLHKNQEAAADKGSLASFFLFRTAKALKLLFNDELKYNTSISEYSLKGNGSNERRSLLNTRDLDVQLEFRNAVQVNARTLLVPSTRARRLKLARIVY